jgi:hypothetical protein
MRRAAVLLWGTLLLSAAPQSYSLLPGRDVPPAAPRADSPAPVPDPDMASPPASGAGPAAFVRPGVTRPSLGPTVQSQGYTRGSSYTSAIDHRFRPAPTLNLSVKLQ